MHFAGLRHVHRFAPIVSIVVTSTVALTAGASAPAPAPAAAAGPAVTILSPADGARQHRERLRVHALVQTGRGSSIHEVTLWVDGRPSGRLDTAGWGSPISADFLADLGSLAEGPHVIEVRAAAPGRRGAQASATVIYTIDRSLPTPERNLVEDSATPLPFATFDIKAAGGPPPRGRDTLVNGTLRPSAIGNGLSPCDDRMVLALGTDTHVIEPGTLRCVGRGRVALGHDVAPRVKWLLLLESSPGVWHVSLQVEGPTNGSRLLLRVGDDWGGVDLATGERVVSLAPPLDASLRQAATIGPDGGTLETMDAGGVRIRLTVPDGALTEPTEISMTPIASPVLPGAQTIPGIQFAPAGLTFARPATLTFHPGAAGLPSDAVVYLLTSPLTALPLETTANAAEGTLTAPIAHFTNVAPAPPNATFSDLVQWGNAVLSSGQALTLSELQSLAGLLELQRLVGCAGACLDEALIAQRATESAQALVGAGCARDIASPTDGALRRWLELQALVTRLGGDPSDVRGCARDVLGALVAAAADLGRSEPWEQAHLQRVLSLYATAQQLAFGAVFEQLVRGHVLGVLDARVQFEGQHAVANPTTSALQRLVELIEIAELLGFAGGEDDARGHLAAALRALFDRASQLCRTDPQGGRQLLEGAAGFALFAAPVDPTIETDVQGLIAACAGSASDLQIVVKSRVGGPGAVVRAWNAGVVHEETSTVPVPLPLTLSAAAGGNLLSFSAIHSGNTIAVTSDGRASVVIGDTRKYGTQASLALQITAARSGTLTVSVNHDWTLPWVHPSTPADPPWPHMFGCHYSLWPSISVNSFVAAGSVGFTPVCLPEFAVPISGRLVAGQPAQVNLSWDLYLNDTIGAGTVFTITFVPD
jgi:hypothetical protein